MGVVLGGRLATTVSTDLWTHAPKVRISDQPLSCEEFNGFRRIPLMTVLTLHNSLDLEWRLFRTIVKARSALTASSLTQT